MAGVIFDDKTWAPIYNYVDTYGSETEKKAFNDWMFKTGKNGVNSAYNFDDKTWKSIAGYIDTNATSEEKDAFYDLTSKTGWKQYDAIKLLQDSLANRPTFSAYQNPEKQAEYNAIRQRYLDREFHYDPSADPAAEALRREYINGGRLAMRDTLGTASAATGGLASSYAQQAGQQAYGAYMKDYATNVIPSLKQMARQKYEQETNDILGKLGILKNEMNAESDKNYQEYMANETAWQNELATKLQIAEYKQTELKNQQKAQTDAYKEKLEGAKGQLENVFEGLDLSTQDGRAKAAENVEKLVGMYASDAQEAYQLLQDLLGTNYNFTFDDYLKAIEDGRTTVQSDRLRPDSY